MAHNPDDMRCMRCLQVKPPAKMVWMPSPCGDGQTLVCRTCVTEEEVGELHRIANSLTASGLTLAGRVTAKVANHILIEKRTVT